MTIDEAIEIKEKELTARRDYPDSKLKQADQLSIEALRRLKKYRQDGEEMRFTPLPGETKD